MTDGSILVVEDDTTLVRAITRNLSARGFSVFSAGTVQEALVFVQGTHPALVILDIDLPDGSGWEVLRDIRAHGGDDVAVVVISALAPNPRLIAELGVRHVLEKPFPIDSLLRLCSLAASVPSDGPATRAGTEA